MEKNPVKGTATSDTLPSLIIAPAMEYTPLNVILSWSLLEH